MDKFPSLSTVAEKLLAVYFMLSAGKHELSQEREETSYEDESDGKFISHDGRLVSTR